MNLPGNKGRKSTRPAETWIEKYPQVSRSARAVYAGYPSTYRVGMSNLGFHFLFSALAGSGEFRVERFFTDTSPNTFESGSKLSTAFALFLTISYEEDFLNLVRILNDAGIEPEREKRRLEPMIIVGGPAVSSNPLPLFDIVDAAVLGEGEIPVEKIIETIAGSPSGKRSDILSGLGSIPGVVTPARRKRREVIIGGTVLNRFPHSVILSPDTVFSDTALFEISRGCPGSCGFCLASALYRPYRPASIESIERVLVKSKVPIRKAGLVSTAVTAHPSFFEIVDMFMRKGIELGFSSLRASEIDEKKAWLIGRASTRSVSLAPESGSERLRFNLGKGVKDEYYIRAADLLAKNGIRQLSLYLLTGYPGEDMQALEETGIFLQAVRKAGRGMSIAVHVNTMVPKPWTPMQFYPMPAEKQLKSRTEELSSLCRKLGIVCKAKSVRSSLRQAVLSLGGREVGSALISLAAGSVSWKKALLEAGVDPSLPHLERGIDGDLPWDSIDGPFTRDRLLKRYRSMSL